MRSLLFLVSAMLALPALGQTPGSCEPGTAQAVLDVSDVQASLFNNGGLFYRTTALGEGYIVPKETGHSPLHRATLWIAGQVDSEVRASFSRFGGQLWPGPLNTDGTLPNSEDCSAYDHIWTVSTYDVAIYDETGVASSDLADWPVGLGAPAMDATGQPVVVTNREQTLDLANGERPVISGTQTAFWVMNDVGNKHIYPDYYDADTAEWIRIETPPLGIEVAVTAFAVVSEETALHQATIYSYTLTNRNTLPITDAHLGFWADPDLGSCCDDYMGSDTTRNMAFLYNQKDSDSVYGTPPALGFDFLDSLWTASFVYDDLHLDYVGTLDEAYNRLSGLANDGTPFCEGGFYGACGDGLSETRYTYAGDPLTESFWSALNIDGEGTDETSYDQIMVLGSPPFDLQPGESRTFPLAVVFGQGLTHLTSIIRLREASDLIQAAYDAGSLFETTAATPLLPTPTLRQPAPGASFYDETIPFQWWASGQRYRLEISQSQDFPLEGTFVTHASSSQPEIDVPDELVNDEPVPLYWRVRAESNTQRSPWSATHSFTYYRYIPRVTTLSDGTPAIVEIVGPGGIDPCGPLALTRTGCDEIQGHVVYGVLNSTATYTLSTRLRLNRLIDLARAPSNDFEIRMTGSSFAHASTEPFTVVPPYPGVDQRLIEVPFELWDIGPTSPGEVNDPSDDERLIPILRNPIGSLGDDPCELRYATQVFSYSARPARLDTIWATKLISGYYPNTSYEDFADYASGQIDADPSGCPEIPSDSVSIYLSQAEGRTYPDGPPLYQVQFTDPSLDQTGSTEDLQGTVIRFYTTDPLPVSKEATPHAGNLTLGPAYPNPTASSLTVPYRLASPSEVELAIYDVLGRRVVELVNARQPEGVHEAALDASALAPGVYVVRLRADEEMRSTRITVVR